MVIYRQDYFTSGSLGSIAVTGANAHTSVTLTAPPTTVEWWQPSRWPAPPASWDPALIETLRSIFKESMMDEIDNVIADAHRDLRHRGHVVTLALLCALDTISSYGYGARSGNQIPPFTEAHFPQEYRPFAEAILKLYRHAMVHSWNLFGASLLPGEEPVTETNGVISFGILNLRKALGESIESYLKAVETLPVLQQMTLTRYRALRESAE